MVQHRKPFRDTTFECSVDVARGKGVDYDPQGYMTKICTRLRNKKKRTSIMDTCTLKKAIMDT